MWGVIPVRITKRGAWEVDVENLILKSCLTTLVLLLGKTNRLAEIALLGKVSFNVPMVKREEPQGELYPKR